MTCERAQELLLELFGGEKMTPEVREHLAACADCRSFWRELQDLSGRLGSDEMFAISDEEAEAAVARVDAALVPRRRCERPLMSFWHRVRSNVALPAAAAILVLGISVSLYLSETESGLAGFSTSPDVDMGIAELVTGEEDLDRATVDVLLYDLTAQHASFASELLLEDLTEEELEYLEKSFDVKELL